MAYTPGLFVWRELITVDPESAARFYTAVFGWKIQGVPFDGGTYYLVDSGPKQIAGIMALPGGRSVPPHWNPYVSVTDVDAAADRAKALGAQIVFGPVDLPTVGRVATLVDAGGAVMSLFKSAKGDPEPAPPKLGEFCWEQLNASDPPAAKTFHTGVLGWRARPFEGGGLDVFETAAEPPVAVASLVPAPSGAPSHWLSHVVVDGLAEGSARVTANGGRILVPRIDVPRLGAFAVIQDPQGAVLCIFESRPPA